MPYIDNRKIYIHHSISRSSFTKANIASIPEHRNKIGASVSATNFMLSSGEEMKVLMPTIIGCDPNNSEWTKKLKMYWENISKVVPEVGLSLEIGFEYPTKEKYNEYSKALEQIDKQYDTELKADPQNEADIWKRKLNNIISLETRHYEYGKPINLSDYVLWRHCLVYRDIAKREQDVNKSKHIRFYITDATEVAKRKEAQFKVRTTANMKFYEILGDVDAIDSILLASGKSINNLQDSDKQIMLESIKDSSPEAFIALASDKKLTQRAFIEKCILSGFLKRLPNSETITNIDGEVIGYNMIEVIAYIGDQKNKAFVNDLELKLKSLPKK